MQDRYDCTVSYIIENQNKFYRLAYSYLQNREAAMDAVQNAIVKALENCYSLKNPQAINTWLYRIVVNESLQILRKNKREEPLTDADTGKLIYFEPAYDKDEQVYQEVMRLPEPMKTVVVLHYYEDLTLKQIAEITDTNLSTVKTRLYSALKKMKKNWKVAEQ